MKHSILRGRRNGFTIVELLIVIVVIAVLAAITIVAYNGIQRRAAETLLVSDLTQASKTMEITKTSSGTESYPEVTKSDGAAQGLKSSGGVTFQLTSDKTSYCITGTTDYNVAPHMVTSDNRKPREGVCPGHDAGNVDLPATAASCFKMSGSMVTDYYDHEGNDKAKPECPRSVVIPDSVTSIGQSSFYYKQLTSVVIPSSVTSIGETAFMSNKLTTVTIPDSVTSIGSMAFAINTITSFTYSHSMTSIVEGLFYGNKLTSLTTPNWVTVIESDAFNMGTLTSVVISDSVTSIGVNAFRQNNLTSVVIPDSVKSIDEAAFEINNLTTVTIGADTTIKSDTFDYRTTVIRR